MVVTIKLLAHAGFQVKTGNKVVYIDMEEHGKPSEKADLILVTHSHPDHCDLSKIKMVRKKDTIIIAPMDCVSKIGGNVNTLKPGEETTVTGINIKAIDAYNYKRFRSTGNPFHPKDFGVGYLVTIEGKTVYHAGDTDFIPEMRQFGHIDVALLPTGDTYTMDNSEAALAALAIDPQTVIPMHRWNTNPDEFKKKVEANSKINVLILREGEEYQIP
jgi:L-ascorbate metabolism protein UlaG (beta-lactamase superfamily)